MHIIFPISIKKILNSGVLKPIYFGHRNLHQAKVFIEIGIGNMTFELSQDCSNIDFLLQFYSTEYTYIGLKKGIDQSIHIVTLP